MTRRADRRPSKARYRRLHFNRRIGERAIDERTSEREPKRWNDWILDNEKYDIPAVDDALPSNVFIRKSSDEYVIGIVEKRDGKTRYIPTHTLAYKASGVYRNHLYMNVMYSEPHRARKGLGSYLLREFIKDADKRNKGLHLQSMSATEQGMTAEQRSRMWKSFGFEFLYGSKNVKSQERTSGHMSRKPHRSRNNSKYKAKQFDTEREIIEAEEKHRDYWRNYKAKTLIVGTGKPLEVED